MADSTLVSTYLQRAREFIRKKDLLAAIREIDAGLQATPSDPELYFALGYCHDSQGQKELAIAAYKSVLRINPDHIEARRFLGLAFIEVGNTENGVAVLNKVFKQLREEVSNNNLLIDNLKFRHNELKDIETNIDSLKASKTTLENEVSALEDMKAQLLTVFDKLQTDIAKLDKDSKAKLARKEKLEKEHKSIKGEIKKTSESIQEEIQRLEELKKQKDTLEESISYYSSQRDEIALKTQSSQKAQNKLLQEVDKLKTEMERLQAQKKDLENNIVMLQQKIKDQPQQDNLQSNKNREFDIPDWMKPSIIKNS